MVSGGGPGRKGKGRTAAAGGGSVARGRGRGWLHLGWNGSAVGGSRQRKQTEKQRSSSCLDSGVR